VVTKARYSYYPGCSLHGTGKAYDLSVKAVCHRLGIELAELKDWNCCGATSAHALQPWAALALPGRNVAIAEQAGLDVAVPCAACYSREKACERALQENQQTKEKLEAELHFSYTGRARFKHLLEVFVSDYGLENLREKIVRPLGNVKAVGYYGCLLVRPPDVTGFDDPEDPKTLDQVIQVCGAQLATWYAKTDCCGGSLGLTRSDVVGRMVSRIMLQALDAGADCIVVACPLCQSNLESRQSASSKLLGKELNIPILYFTQLLGLAMGISAKELGLNTHLISPAKIIKSMSAPAALQPPEGPKAEAAKEEEEESDA
jgi:heterodisulfide reductase subunit B